MSYRQEVLFGIVRIPYGDVAYGAREDMDDDLCAALTMAVKPWPTATVELLDEHGVSEWIAEAVERGLRKERTDG